MIEQCPNKKILKRRPVSLLSLLNNAIGIAMGICHYNADFRQVKRHFTQKYELFTVVSEILTLIDGALNECDLF